MKQSAEEVAGSAQQAGGGAAQAVVDRVAAAAGQAEGVVADMAAAAKEAVVGPDEPGTASFRHCFFQC